MSCIISEEQLFSWIDRRAPELEEHLVTCPDCRLRSQALRATMDEVSLAVGAGEPRLPERVGQYEILRLLGAGGQGWVFEARQQSPRRTVALKVVKGGTICGEQDSRRLRREAETLARLKHPGIAAIYEAGRTEAGESFFVMELVNGRPLTAYAEGHTLDRRLQLFRKVCEALEYAHRQGVIHRDLKPSNILVEEGDQPKILDFGLAYMVDPEVSRSTAQLESDRILGTLRYMSPEHARGDLSLIDARSDQYSLGVILYELLADEPPYELRGVLPHEALRIICEQRPVRPSRRNRRLAGDLETIVLKTLDKDPAQRYATIAEFSDDLERYLTGRPITARPPSLGYRFRKLVARNRLATALFATIFLLSASFATWIGLQYAEARASLRGLDVPFSPIEAAMNLVELADVNYRLGELGKAEHHCRRALAALDVVLPRGSKDVLKVRVLLGRILTRSGKAAEAEESLRMVLRSYVQAYPSEKHLIADARGALGACLARLGQFEEAAGLLRRSHASMAALRGNEDYRTREVVERLVELYESWGKPQEASRYRALLPASARDQPSARPATPAAGPATPPRGEGVRPSNPGPAPRSS